MRSARRSPSLGWRACRTRPPRLPRQSHPRRVVLPKESRMGSRRESVRSCPSWMTGATREGRPKVAGTAGVGAPAMAASAMRVSAKKHQKKLDQNNSKKRGKCTSHKDERPVPVTLPSGEGGVGATAADTDDAQLPTPIPREPRTTPAASPIPPTTPRRPRERLYAVSSPSHHARPSFSLPLPLLCIGVPVLPLHCPIPPSAADARPRGAENPYRGGEGAIGLTIDGVSTLRGLVLEVDGEVFRGKGGDRELEGNGGSRGEESAIRTRGGASQRRRRRRGIQQDQLTRQ